MSSIPRESDAGLGRDLERVGLPKRVEIERKEPQRVKYITKKKRTRAGFCAGENTERSEPGRWDLPAFGREIRLKHSHLGLR